MSHLPFVSIIVPVLNSPARVKQCIESSLSQTYPKDKYEIIIVDNGSTDNTIRVIEQYPVKILVEKDIQTPYAARNKGIYHAQGEIIALTDANCSPQPDWIKEGITALQEENADLAIRNYRTEEISLRCSVPTGTSMFPARPAGRYEKRS